MWANPGFLFFVSLIPFFTAYLADSRMSSFPTALYAGIFTLVTVAFMFLQEAIAGQFGDDREWRAMDRAASKRDWIALALYGLAIPAAYLHPAVSRALIVGVGVLYFKPNARA